MKKISRRSFITAMAAVSAAGVLAACGSSASSTASSVASSAVSSEATSSAASMDETGTHTVRDGGGQPSLVVLKGAAAPEYAHVFHADLLEMCQLSVCIIEAGDGSNGGCHKIIVVHSDDSFPRDKAPARMSAGKDDFIRCG